MMHSQNYTDGPITLMALVSSSPLRPCARIRGGLGWRRDRDFRFRVRPNGIDVGYSTRTALDLDLCLDAGPPIDLAGDIPPEVTRRIAAAVGRGADSFGLIELEPDEAERLSHGIAGATPSGTGPALPVLDGYSPRNGVLVPVALLRKHLPQHVSPTRKGSAMPHPLQRSAPEAFKFIKGIGDDPNNVIGEFILYEFARAQGLCKRIDHIKGNTSPRANALSEEDIDAVVKTQAAIACRKASGSDEPLIDPLPDGTIAVIPLLGQNDKLNVILLACFVAHGRPGTMRFALDIDEVLPTISSAVLEGLGRKPNHEAAE